MILKNYGTQCAITGIDIPQLLMASHIIPWSDKAHKQYRLNHCNGICPIATSSPIIVTMFL